MDTTGKQFETNRVILDEASRIKSSGHRICTGTCVGVNNVNLKRVDGVTSFLKMDGKGHRTVVNKLISAVDVR
jgi:hypothetical protein